MYSRSGLQDVQEADVIIAEIVRSPKEITNEVIRVFLVIIPLVFTSIVAELVTSKLCQRNSFTEFMIQVLIIAISLVLSITVCVDTVCNFISPVLIVGFIIFTVYWLKIKEKSGSWKKIKIQIDQRPQSLTSLRSAINIMTSCAILACDFKIFPHDFTKSRTYGAGLMDTGIGLFVFSMGMVSKPVKNKKDLKRMLIQVGPLLFLGLLRTVIIKATGYHQDDREYGRDLNAFVTLGVTKLIGGLITMVIPSGAYLLISGFSVVTLHETILQKGGLANYCLDPNLGRESLFEANREGIVSITGFVSLYLFSLYIGLLIRNAKNQRLHDFKTIIMKILLISLNAWVLTFCFINTTGLSRRIANFGYVSWVISLATTMLLIFLIIFDVLWKVIYKHSKRCMPVLFDIINFNGLVYFLVSNVLTGSVNIFLSPEDRTPFESILILYVYMIIPCILNRYLFVKNIRLC